ncbi:MAG: hypothetical protein IH819_02115, partial [Bacteroidetes bacterium]|nr:hypothetical protein [Bacteroidota bacterium]
MKILPESDPVLASLSLPLLVAVLLLVPATALLFTVRAPRAGHGHHAPLSVPVAVLGALGVGVAVVPAAALVALPPTGTFVTAVLMGASVLVWLPVARPWDVRGLVAWALSVDAGVLYLAYV